MSKRDLLSITDLNKSEILEILKLAQTLKKDLKTTGHNQPIFKDQTLIMIFEKPSLRTRISFEIGMTQLGGHAIYLAPQDIGLGVRESVSDVAKVVSRMGNLIMARTFKHQTIVDLAKDSSMPVINGLSDLEHPCQIMADLLTMLEIKTKLSGLKVVYMGDCENNVTHTLALGCATLGMHFVTASPAGYEMKKSITSQAEKLAQASGGSITHFEDPEQAVVGADVVYTDTWISMGDEAEKVERLKIFPPYQVTTKLMKLAKKDAIFMHDLPAYRDHEIQAAVIDGPQSAVFQQAENRLHAQKAIMIFLKSV